MPEQQLKQLGFSDKEAKVYMASLELGPDTAQEIAKKAGVNRTTTYVIIEKLIKKGKKRSFRSGWREYDGSNFYESQWFNRRDFFYIINI